MRLEIILLAVAIFLVLVVGIRLMGRLRTVQGGSSLGVTPLVESLTKELEQIDKDRQAKGNAALLQLKEVEVEVSFIAKQDSTTAGNAQLEVVTVGQTESYSKEEVQRLKITLLAAPSRTGVAKPTAER